MSSVHFIIAVIANGKGYSAMKISGDTHLCLSIISTGKCNCNCTYCHFFADRSREEYNKDIDDALFNRYVDYIKYLKTITPHVVCRLSGGEPLYMGNKVFDLTDRIASVTGISPYIMTNGKLLSRELLLMASQHHVSSFVVSVENPFAISNGAVNSRDVIEKFNVLQNDTVPLYFGMLVLANSQYKNIKRIADYFFQETGTIPPMCETNFLPYRSPTKDEMEDLYVNVRDLVREYNGKAPISLFPYVIPEYYSGNLDFVEYLSELPIDDTFQALEKSNYELLQCTEQQLERSYFPYDCGEYGCDWYESCRRLKWVWQIDTDQLSSRQKLADYCRFKKALSKAFFDALVG